MKQLTRINHKNLFFCLGCLLIPGDWPAAGQTPEINSLMASNGTVRLEWNGGLAPYRLLGINLQDTNDVQLLADQLATNSIRVAAAESNRMYRVDALGQIQPQRATYNVTFANNWTAANHPDSYPASAHYSPWIGATHGDGVAFWTPGVLATTGIKNVAEFGNNLALSGEIAAAIQAGTAASEINLSTFSLDQDFSRVTLVSMVAPSPDWFIGVHGVQLFEEGAWVDDLSVDLFPYDAGTDDGPTYISFNQASDPRVPIFRIVGAPFLNGGEVRKMGTLRFQRVP